MGVKRMIKREDVAMNRRSVRARLSLAEFTYNGCFASANYLPVFLQAT